VKKIIAFMLMVSLVIFAGCSSKSSTSASKNAMKIKYNDISSQNKYYSGELPDNVVEIHEIRAHSGKYGYQAFFRQWKPYKKLNVISEGFTIKIYYEEKDTDKLTNTFISWNCNFGAGEKDIQVYRNGKLVEQGIGFLPGIE